MLGFLVTLTISYAVFFIDDDKGIYHMLVCLDGIAMSGMVKPSRLGVRPTSKLLTTLCKLEWPKAFRRIQQNKNV